MSAIAKLKMYRKKRNFSRTDEPSGDSSHTPLEQHQRFVIQQHSASHMHFDLRLEIDGVLVSWAVPKGPSLDPDIKRLAIQTEDHPLSYMTFEGIIPQGEYGGGTVMVWDIGTYTNLKELHGISIQKSYQEGRIEFTLYGKKLQGGFALIRTRMAGKSMQWLLFKLKDFYASKRKNPVTRQTKSALTGRTLYQISKDAR